MKKAIISLSGGLDSTCLLMYLLSKGYQVKAYSFYYGQKHAIELKKVKKNIKFLERKGLLVEWKQIDLTDCFNESVSSLHIGGEEIPEGHYAEENMKSTVVENRNVIFAAILYGKALSWAKREGEPVTISLGTHSGDHFIYFDCRPESREACEHAFKVSNEGSEMVSYEAPFIDIDKGQVLSKGINAMRNLNFRTSEIKKVLSNTHTCYNPDSEGRSCGKCGSCTERLEAFEKNNMKDPIEYQNHE